MRDNIGGSGPTYLVVPATISADNTPSVIDLAGYNAANIHVQVGVGGITFSGSNKVEFILKHGDASDGSDQAAVAVTDVTGVTATSGIIRSLIAAHASATVVSCGYVGTKRYISCLADFSGTHGTGTPIAVLCTRGFPVSVTPA
jgi:hypothetical protein